MDGLTIGLLGVPSSAGAHGPGQEKAPAALRRAGIVERLAAAGVEVHDEGDLPLARYQPGSPDRKAQNLDRVVAVARSVAERVDYLRRRGLTPLVLGGDCTITLGVVSGFLRAGEDIGLLYVDADTDLATPATTTSGILDSMGVAHLLGDGAPALARIGPRHPLLAGDRLTLFAYQPGDLEDHEAQRLDASGARHHSTEDLGAGAAAAASAAMADLAARAGAVLVHADVDTVDSAEFPLGDYPHHNTGLPFDDFAAVLRAVAREPSFAGMVVTEANPDHDPDGALVDRLAGALAGALGGAVPARARAAVPPAREVHR